MIKLLLKRPRILLLVALVSAIPLGSATLEVMSQIRAPTAGLVASDGTQFYTPGIGAGLILANGTLSLTGQPSGGGVNVGGGAPEFAVTKVTPGMPNSFQMPPGRNKCAVHRNGILYAQSEDYNIAGNAVAFNLPPLAGDIIQLMCWVGP